MPDDQPTVACTAYTLKDAIRFMRTAERFGLGYTITRQVVEDKPIVMRTQHDAWCITITEAPEYVPYADTAAPEHEGTPDAAAR